MLKNDFIEASRRTVRALTAQSPSPALDHRFPAIWESLAPESLKVACDTCITQEAQRRDRVGDGRRVYIETVLDETRSGPTITIVSVHDE